LSSAALAPEPGCSPHGRAIPAQNDFPFNFKGISNMRRIASLLGALALAVAAVPASAQIHSAYTYAGLAWGFSTGHAGFSTCGTVFIDATGDLYNSDDYSTYGRLSCTGGYYALVGNAYFDNANQFNMTLRLGVTHNLQCNNLVGLSGQCPIYDNLGNQTGFAVINLL
jgi:hypothetical protein